MQRCDEAKQERGHEIRNQDIQWETVGQIRHHQHDELAQHSAETSANEYKDQEIDHAKSPLSPAHGKRAPYPGG